MKRNIIAVLLVAGTVFSAQAQEGPSQTKARFSAEKVADRQTEQLTTIVELTESQKKAIYEANLQALKKMETQREQNHELRKAVRTEREEAYRAILSPNQYQKYSEKKKEMRAQRGKAEMHRTHKQESGSPYQKRADK